MPRARHDPASPFVAKRKVALAPSECWIVANSIVSSAMSGRAKRIVRRWRRRRPLVGELISLARRSMTVASHSASRTRRFLEARVQEPGQARGRFDGDRCFARAERCCCSTPGPAHALQPMASTSESPGGSSGVTLVMRPTVLVAPTSAFPAYNPWPAAQSQTDRASRTTTSQSRQSDTREPTFGFIPDQ